MLEEIKNQVQNLNDEELFELLDLVSGEVKRRNGLAFPNVADIHNQSVEQNVKMVLDALSNLGVKVNKP